MMSTVNKKLVAYQVNEECEGFSVVVFHSHAMAARRIGAERLGEDFEAVTCFRVPHFDQYADFGKVPVIARLQNGWWFQCPHCRKKVSEDDCDLGAVVTEHDNAYCDQLCFDAHKKEIADHNDAFEKLADSVQQLRPDLKFIKFTGLWPQLTFTAEFKFEGCQFGGSVRKDHRKDGLEWYVANGDKEAWEHYETTRKQDAAQ